MTNPTFSHASYGFLLQLWQANLWKRAQKSPWALVFPVLIAVLLAVFYKSMHQSEEPELLRAFIWPSLLFMNGFYHFFVYLFPIFRPPSNFFRAHWPVSPGLKLWKHFLFNVMDDTTLFLLLLDLLVLCLGVLTAWQCFQMILILFASRYVQLLLRLAFSQPLLSTAFAEAFFQFAFVNAILFPL